jgi:putative transposase
VDKVRDIVGLYLNPPDHAVVLCLDERSQVETLDATTVAADAAGHSRPTNP